MQGMEQNVRRYTGEEADDMSRMEPSKIQVMEDRSKTEPSKMQEIALKDKLNLTIREAAAYSHIGINRLDAMTKQPGCPFVLYVGRKKLIKRKEFESYLSKSIEL